MHPQLSNLPVTYVLMQIKFSNIEDIANRIPQLQDKIRKDFPHYQPVNIRSIHLKKDQRPTETESTQWHFIDKDKQTGIILDKQTLTIHTSHYKQFNSLLTCFKQVVSHFHEILDFTLFTRLGVRYINLIEEGLANVDVGLKGFHLKNHSFDEHQFFTKNETRQRTQEGFMKVQALSVSDKKLMGNDQNIFVPGDLTNTAKSLSFESQKEPKQEFLLLDLDHFSAEQGDFEIEEIFNQFKQLQETLYLGFCQAVGKANLEAWS